MIRIASLVAFLAVVAALVFVPGVSPSRLATKQAGELLTATLTVPGPDGKDVERPLWKDILESRAVVTELDENGLEARVLRVGGAGFLTDIRREGEGYDFLWPSEVAKSVVRELRSIVEEEKLDISIEAYKKPDPDGFTVLADVKEDTYRLTATIGRSPGEEFLGSREVPRKRVSKLSLLPPLVAIFFAILLRRPIIALFSGVWVGAFLVRWLAGESAATAPLGGFKDVFTKYLGEQLKSQARTEIILFVVFMLAMVGILTRAGGIRGIMNSIAGLARDARKTQIATWLMGLTIFFDDYANTILVGSTMRPLADKYRVAREKLAYIVDSTAAPVAGVSILSTWIAFEVSTFSAQLPDAGLGANQGYAIFLQTLPFRFYCWFTLIFVGMIVLSGRDFGPMLTAERRARSGKLLRDGATPLVGKAATELEAREGVEPRATTALLPLAVFVFTTLGTIIYTGCKGLGVFAEKGSEAAAKLELLSPLQFATGILYEGSGETPLMYGAIAGFVVAAILALLRGLGAGEILMAALNSLKAMGVAIVILYLAWMVGAACSDLSTAAYLSATLTEAIPYMLLPVILFLLAGLIAFSTGSSWSTMTILLPLVIGLAYDIGFAGTPEGFDPRTFGLGLMVISIGAVLEGAIFGDHCSPISDTTVMSSIACASDHVDHVRTQAPYALLTMFVALFVGYLPVTFFQLPWWIALLAGSAVLWGFLMLKGKRADVA
ncbi:Na+/H+ antiporter NhaC family protein [Saltatorellus ferox]